MNSPTSSNIREARLDVKAAESYAATVGLSMVPDVERLRALEAGQLVSLGLVGSIDDADMLLARAAVFLEGLRAVEAARQRHQAAAELAEGVGA